jgi:hypothetical protein
MNGWAVIIILFAVALLPWQIFRYARRKNDSVPGTSKPKSPDRDESDGFW